MVEVEAPETEAEVIRRGVALLEDRMPAGWSTRMASESDDRIDAVVEVQDRDGKLATLVVEAKRVVEGRDVGPLREQLDALAERFPQGQGLVLARYLSPPVQARLAEAGLSYVDATGNMRIAIDSPGLFLSDRGADRDPWRGPGRPRGTLKGEPAAKIVRAIADFAGSWTIRELIDVSKASTGSTYRVVEFLEREGLATRSKDGRVSASDWPGILRRWSNDYGFVRTNQVTRYIAPRGLSGLTDRIATTDPPTRYAVTGTLAAAHWADYAPARLAMIYTMQPDLAAATWDLRPADAGANVILALPKYDVVLDRSITTDGNIVVASSSQVAVDLMTGPGRNPAEAEELLGWMERNEQSWRA